MTTYAYIRVSIKDQRIDRQIMAIEGYQIPEKNVYCDWQSGKDFNRPSYKKLIKQLKPGDLIVIKSIDRLGRNYNEILHQWQRITKEIAAAKAKGKTFGRPAASPPENFQSICKRYYQGIITSREAAKELGLSHTTFYRMAYKKQEKLRTK